MKFQTNSVAGRPLLIDTNLLLLLAVGTFDHRLVGRGRLEKFDHTDLVRLRGFATKSSRLFTTPHVLTEVSNLASQMVDQRRRATFFQRFATLIAALDEQRVPSETLTKESVFGRFGLTDASIVRCAGENVLILTEDFPLAGALQRLGLSVINFNHLRSF